MEGGGWRVEGGGWRVEGRHGLLDDWTTVKQIEQNSTQQATDDTYGTVPM